APLCCVPPALPLAADEELLPLAQPASTPAAAAAARAATSERRAAEGAPPVIAGRAAGVDLLLMARYLRLTHCFFRPADADEPSADFRLRPGDDGSGQRR